MLFNDGEPQIRAAVEALLSAGYVPSAKHPFQLLKKLRVEEKPLVFNIDLMHPDEPTFGGRDMFHDIMDLGIRENYDGLETHIIKSIAFPSAKIIFKENLWSTVDVEGHLPSGQLTRIGIPLMDEAGLILSKCQSVSKQKRERDAFDIYFVLSGPNAPATIKTLKSLKRFDQVGEQLDHLRRFVEEEPGRFNYYVQTSVKTFIVGDPAAIVKTALFSS